MERPSAGQSERRRGSRGCRLRQPRGPASSDRESGVVRAGNRPGRAGIPGYSLMRLAEFLLGGSVTFVLYTYFGYPVLLWVLARVRCVQVLRGDMEPSVSLIIAAHNEERRIREKLENTLSQDY